MAHDPIEQHFAEQRAEDARRAGWAGKAAGLGLTAGALILDPATGVAALLGRALGLAGDHLAGREVKALGERVQSVEERLGAIEALQGGQGRRVRGHALRVLRLTLETELASLCDHLNADEAMATLRLTAAEYREAAQELAWLGLVRADGSAGHATGYVRTRLLEDTVLRVGPAVFPAIDWEDEVARILVSIERDKQPGLLFRSTTLLERTGIPLPRLSLELEALDDLGLIEGRGPRTDEWGAFHAVSLTVAGRRVLRGDDTLQL